MKTQNNQETCRDCGHHRIKTYIDPKDNNLLRKEFCSRFEQDLKTIKTCEKFEAIRCDDNWASGVAVLPISAVFVLIAVVLFNWSIPWYPAKVLLLVAAAASFAVGAVLIDIGSKIEKKELVKIKEKQKEYFSDTGVVNEIKKTDKQTKG